MSLPTQSRWHPLDTQRSSVPPSYIWSLEFFVYEKLDAAHRRPGYAALYDQQLRYVSALSAQLPPRTALSASKPVVFTVPPSSTHFSVARQGPFLFQPEPHDLKGSPGGDAVDMVFLSVASRAGPDTDEHSSALGVVLIVYQDGKVDICLDLEKTEAKWEHAYVRDGSLTSLPTDLAITDPEQRPPALYGL